MRLCNWRREVCDRADDGWSIRWCAEDDHGRGSVACTEGDPTVGSSSLELRVHVKECTHGVGGGEFLGGEGLRRIDRESCKGDVVADTFQEADGEPSS